MASAAQLASNRANAQRSTGPSTPASKNVSRFNALKSGIDAESMVIPGEEPAELDTLKANYQLQFEPITPVEQFLVDGLTRAQRRIDAAERSYFRSLKELERQIGNRSEIAEVPVECTEVKPELGSFRQTVAVAAAATSEPGLEGAIDPASRRYEAKENLALRL